MTSLNIYTAIRKTPVYILASFSSLTHLVSRYRSGLPTIKWIGYRRGGSLRRSQINAVRLRLVKLKIHSKKRKSIQTNPRIVWVRSCPTSVGGIFQESSESRLEVIFDLIIQVLIYSLLYLRNGGRDNNTTWQLCSVNRVVFTSIARELQW